MGAYENALREEQLERQRELIRMQRNLAPNKGYWGNREVLKAARQQREEAAMRQHIYEPPVKYNYEGIQIFPSAAAGIGMKTIPSAPVVPAYPPAYAGFPKDQPVEEPRYPDWMQDTQVPEYQSVDTDWTPEPEQPPAYVGIPEDQPVKEPRYPDWMQDADPEPVEQTYAEPEPLDWDRLAFGRQFLVKLFKSGMENKHTRELYPKAELHDSKGTFMETHETFTALNQQAIDETKDPDEADTLRLQQKIADAFKKSIESDTRFWGDMWECSAYWKEFKKMLDGMGPDMDPDAVRSAVETFKASKVFKAPGRKCGEMPTLCRILVDNLIKATEPVSVGGGRHSYGVQAALAAVTLAMAVAGSIM
jgi:hypothetical protein